MWLMMLGLSVGPGLPVGIPPGPEDPLLAKVAPEECVFYASWSGTAAPDPASANRVERLAAEPELQFMVAEIKRRVIEGIAHQVGDGDPDVAPVVKDIAAWVETLLTHPTAIFISDLETSHQAPEIRGGALVRVGDQAAAIKARLEKYQKKYLGDMAQPIDVAGETWYRLKLDPEAPTLIWGARGKYIILGIGEGSVEEIYQRASTPPPAWLTKLREQLPVERVSTVSYLNTKVLLEQFVAEIHDQDVQKFVQASGMRQITSIGSVTGLDGDGFINRTHIGVDGEPAGLLTILNGEPLTAKDLAAIPADSTLALAARVSAENVYDAIFSMVGEMYPRDREYMDRDVVEFEKMVGINLRNDVLRALGDTVCIYNSPGDGGLVFTGLTAVIPVKDHAALSGAMTKMMTVAKAEFERSEQRMREMAEEHGFRFRPQPKIKQSTFAGREIYFFDVREAEFPFAPAWCLTETELVVALFPQNVRSYLLREETPKPLTDVPDVAAVFEGGNGPIALAYVDTPALFDLAYPLAPMFMQVISGEMHREGFDFDISILPSASAIRKHLKPDVATLSRTEAGFEFTCRQSVPTGGLGPVVWGFLFLAPMTHSVDVEAKTAEPFDGEGFGPVIEEPQLYKQPPQFVP